MKDITERVRVEAGKARKRAPATPAHLVETGYARAAAAGAKPPKGWRVDQESNLLIRTFDAQGRPIVLGEPYQYLTREQVYYVYVLYAVRHPDTGEVRPRYVPVDQRASEEAALLRAAEVAAALPTLEDENDDGVIDFRDMPVVEV